VETAFGLLLRRRLGEEFGERRGRGRHCYRKRGFFFGADSRDGIEDMRES
jgi:hypothetical protein